MWSLQCGFVDDNVVFLICSLLDQTSLLEFLHILTTNHKLVFAHVNSEPEFVAGLCHWLLVMGTHKSLAVSDERKARENKNPEGDDEKSRDLE